MRRGFPAATSSEPIGCNRWHARGGLSRLDRTPCKLQLPPWIRERIRCEQRKALAHRNLDRLECPLAFHTADISTCNVFHPLHDPAPVPKPSHVMLLTETALQSTRPEADSVV